MSTPIIISERIELRPLKPDDADEVFKWFGDECVTKYLPFNTFMTVDEVRDSLTRIVGSDNDYSYNFGYVLRESNLLIGNGNIYHKEAANAWSMGFMIRYDYWNKGYATEAVRAMINFICEKKSAKRFVAKYSDENPASGKVLEKCGLHFDHYEKYGSADGKKIFHGRCHLMELEP